MSKREVEFPLGDGGTKIIQRGDGGSYGVGDGGTTVIGDGGSEGLGDGGSAGIALA